MQNGRNMSESESAKRSLLPTRARARASSISRGRNVLIGLAKRQTQVLCFALVMQLVQVALSLAPSIFCGAVIDVVAANSTGARNLPWLVRQTCEVGRFRCADGARSVVEAAVIGIVAVSVLSLLATAAASFLKRIGGARLLHDVRVTLHSTILSQELAFFERHASGELVSRLNADVDTFGDALSYELLNRIGDALVVAASLSYCGVLSPTLLAVTCGAVPLGAASAAVLGRQFRGLARDASSALAAATAEAAESFGAAGGALTVKALGAERARNACFAVRAAAVRRVAIKSAVARGASRGIGTGLDGAAAAATLLVGAHEVLRGNMSAGALATFLLLAQRAADGMAELMSAHATMMQAVGATERVVALLARRPKLVSGHANPPLPPQARGGTQSNNAVPTIEVRDVYFAYRDCRGAPPGDGDNTDEGTDGDETRSTTWALHGVSLRLLHRTLTAVVGGSGSGKSTLASVIARLRDPCEGTVLLSNGASAQVNVRDLPLSWLRSRGIAMLPQSAVLFSGSVRANVELGLGDGAESLVTPSGDDAVEVATRVADAHDFIESLPGGYECDVGERGERLSGGQRQRVALARALIARPRVLVLDEPSSALERQSELRIVEGLLALLRTDACPELSSILVVTHQAEVVRKADWVVVMRCGRVVEEGQPSTLLGDDKHSYCAQIFRESGSGSVSAQ